MSIREKLAGLGSAVKEKVGAAFGDPALSPEAREAQRELDEELAARSSTPTMSPTPRAQMDEGAARAVLGLGEGATLDEVREAARRLARPALAGAAARDEAAVGALDRIATAAELLEERMLPLSGPTAPAGGGGAPPGGRARATSRR